MRGRSVGSLSGASAIPFLQNKLNRSVKAVYLVEDLTGDLLRISSVEWKDSQLLKRQFKVPGKGRCVAKAVERQFPTCIILDAKTLEDHLRVINWWISLSREDKTAAIDSLKQHYCRPKSSNSPLKPVGPPLVVGIGDTYGASQATR